MPKGIYTRSNKYKKWLSNNRKGEGNPMFGKTRSKETRAKASKSLKGKIPWNKGKKCPQLVTNWQGGISSKNEIIRHSVEFRLWREAVFARDNWTCQRCQLKGGFLHPHHIKNFSEYEKLRFAIDNGITLCEKCHRLFHKKYGQTGNTKEQIDEFLINNKQ